MGELFFLIVVLFAIVIFLALFTYFIPVSYTHLRAHET